ncbi:related to MVP1 protein [Rhynchosporium secalis]|uniref:Sorting nexin MVP1 n=1 Tax=Rhynchosporium secalis TaxID=38038 RepID=A0A1E1LVU1_RHYSE|nr:related to MVP1 protein [Rhynchosporium secalis]
MSLFGSSPDQPSPAQASKARNSLFDDEPSPAPGSKSSLFADDDSAPGSSPWAMPTPKKPGREDVVKSLLPAGAVPDSYIDRFDDLINGEEGSGGKLTVAGITKVLSASKLGADEQNRIVSIITSGEQLSDISRNEFNVLLALIGLAQEHEDITLDSVDERRRNLPEPNLPNFSSLIPGIEDLAAKPPQRPVSPPSAPVSVSPQKPRTMRKNSIDFSEADPWGSPALHKGHNHETAPQANGVSRTGNNGTHAPVRNISNFTTIPSAGTNGSSNQPAQNSSQAPIGGVWGSYDGNTAEPYIASNDAIIGVDGFAQPGGIDDRPEPSAPIRSFGGGRTSAAGVKENVVITLLPEKEGIFMFQHHNYQVVSTRRNSKVVRRYSDFVWLLDCLQKRFPFRQLPLLPPKRVGVNGSHLAADNTFIEKRRRGLVRFTNALVRHPVLSQEQLVIMFLTVPTELAVWRKQATISVQEEFTGRPLPPGLEDSLPPTLNELFERTRTGVRRSAEVYINLCNLMDRLSKRNEGLAADQLRLSLSLQSLIDSSADTYATDTNDVPLLNEGLNASAKHLSNSQTLLEDEARAWDQGVLEDLKTQRDALVSMREMFDRRDRYDKDNIPSLERRIQNNETKLVTIRQKPDGLDKESIVAQHARGVFIKECIRDELVFFQQSQYHVGRWNQDWAQERVKYSELQADNWRQLHEELESMPLGD